MTPSSESPSSAVVADETSRFRKASAQNSGWLCSCLRLMLNKKPSLIWGSRDLHEKHNINIMHYKSVNSWQMFSKCQKKLVWWLRCWLIWGLLWKMQSSIDYTEHRYIEHLYWHSLCARLFFFFFLSFSQLDSNAILDWALEYTLNLEQFVNITDVTVLSYLDVLFLLCILRFRTRYMVAQQDVFLVFFATVLG